MLEVFALANPETELVPSEDKCITATMQETTSVIPDAVGLLLGHKARLCHPGGEGWLRVDAPASSETSRRKEVIEDKK
jgi:hypothetical protein